MKIKIIRQQFEEASIINATVFEGKGLHMGRKSRLIIRDNPQKNEIVFIHHGVRLRLEPKIIDSRERTTSIIFNHGVFIMTIEHLLSALMGLGIMNAEIELQGSFEIPILSGNSYDFIEKLLPSVKRTNSNLNMVAIERPLKIQDSTKKDGFISLKPTKNDFLQVKSFIAYENSEIEKQTFTFDFKNSLAYINEISHAKTSFPHRLDDKEEIVKLKRRLKGILIKGDSCNVNVYLKGKSKTFYDNEIARHKILDFLGDLKTSGIYLVNTQVELHKSGHLLNLKLAELVKKEFDKKKGLS